MQIKITSRWNAERVLFECEVPETIASGLATRHALERAVASGAVLRGADLSGAVLRGAVLSGADLRDADLRDADLRDADLRDADLRGADLSGAVLSGADLSGAVLRGAVLSGAVLSGAVLSGADLSGAVLRGAVLSGAGRASDEQAVANLDKVREIILDDSSRLEMGHWHAPESDWRDKSCAEEMLCGTTHCLAGWLQVCSTDDELRRRDAQTAGILAAPVAAKMFFRSDTEVVDWLRDRKYVADIEEANKRSEERKARRAAGAAA